MLDDFLYSKRVHVHVHHTQLYRARLTREERDGMYYLAFNEMAYSSLRHDWDSDRIHDFLNHCRIRHPRDTTLCPDISGDSLQRHDGSGASFFGDSSLKRNLKLLVCPLYIIFHTMSHVGGFERRIMRINTDWYAVAG